MTAFATSADLLARWVGANPPATGLVDTLLGDASQYIRVEFPGIDARIGSTAKGGIEAETVMLVTVAMVTRYLRNPDNAKIQGSGPFSTTYAADQPGAFQLTSEERAKLSGIPLTAGQRAFTIDPTPQAAVGYIGGGFGPDFLGGDWSL